MIMVFYYYGLVSHKKAFLAIVLPVVIVVMTYLSADIVKILMFGGSSVDMRVDQYNGVMNLLGSNMLFGLGLNFAQNYVANLGLHTGVYGFESFFFVVILNSGLVGVFYYIVFFFKIGFDLNRSKRDIIRNFARYTIYPYLVFILLTGELQTLWLFWLIINGAYAIIPILKGSNLVFVFREEIEAKTKTGDDLKAEQAK